MALERTIAERKVDEAIADLQKKLQRKIIVSPFYGESVMTTAEFYELVESMRQAQKNFFNTRKHEFLQESKKLESDVDKAILEYKNRDKPKQKTLI